MTLTASDVSSLKSALDCWEWAGNVSTAVVIIGCIGEFVAEFTTFPKEEKNKHKLARLSLILVIAGISGELWASVRISQFSGLIIANVELQAGDAKISADNATADALSAKGSSVAANIEAGKAEVAAGKARSIAAKAEAQAEESESNLFQLKRETAPRRVTSEQRRKFKSLVQIPVGFNPKLDIFANVNVSDAEDFARDLRDLLNDAGFSATFDDRPTELIGYPIGISGITLQFGRNRIADANALSDALVAYGIATAPIPAQIDSKYLDMFNVEITRRSRPPTRQNATNNP